MTKLISGLLTTLTVTAFAAGAAHANLLVNGSFESGVFTDQGNATETFSAGNTTMPGWTVTGRQLSWINVGNPWGLSAQDGNLFLDLTAYIAGAPFGGVTQTIATTLGQQYDLSFFLGSRTDLWGGPPISITASAAGVSQTFTDNASHNISTWTREDLLFTASGTSTAITLLGTAGVNYIGLDNVSVDCVGTDCSGTPRSGGAVPEPATASLLGFGLAGLAFIRRRILVAGEQSDLGTR
jgi:hypothetical protein